MNTKITFVVFHSGMKYRTQGWLGIKYLVSALKSKADLVIEVKAYSINDLKVAEHDILADMPKIIALPVLQSNLKTIKEYSDSIKPLLKSSIIVIGNIEATIRPLILLQEMENIDIAVIGEGEHTMSELVDCVIQKRSFYTCKGLYYRDGSNIIKTPSRPLEENLDNFAFPDREILPAYTDHNLVVHDLITSRGCYGNCTFCASHGFKAQKGKRVRNRSLDNIMDEIEELVKKYHANYIAIVDDTFCDTSGNAGTYFKAFNNELCKRKITVNFQFNLRSENINEENITIFSEMLNHGLDSIFIGLESGNDEDLKLYGKKANLKTNLNSIQLLHKYNIRYRVGFIMFNPYSTFERINKNLTFLKACNNVFSTHLIASQLHLLNGTALLNKARKEGLLINGQDKSSIDSEYQYAFVNPAIEIVHHYYNMLNNLNIDNIRLDIIDSYLRSCKFHKHPKSRSSQFHIFEGLFYNYLDEIKEKVMHYCYSVLDRVAANHGKSDSKLINHYSHLEKYISEISNQLEECLKTMNIRIAV